MKWTRPAGCSPPRGGDITEEESREGCEGPVFIARTVTASCVLWGAVMKAGRGSHYRMNTKETINEKQRGHGTAVE